MAPLTRSAKKQGDGKPRHSRHHPMMPPVVFPSILNGWITFDDYSTSGVISEGGVRNLQFYRYSGEDLSFCAHLFLRRWWNWSASFMPSWLAPNLITAFGFACNFVAYLLAISACHPPFDGPMPQDVGLWCALLLFSYQTADNIDGRQARATGSSSALGELFDHVCDASSVVFFLVISCCACELNVWYTAWGILLGFVVFHFSHWEEYYVGELIMGRFNGPTEMVLTFVVICTLVGLNLTWILKYPVTLPGSRQVTLSVFVLLALTVAIAFTCIANALKIFRYCREGLAPRQLPAIRSLIDLTSFMVFLLSFVWWCRVSHGLRAPGTPSVLEAHPQLFFLAAQLVYSYVETRLMVHRICGEPVPLVYPIVFVPLVAGVATQFQVASDRTIVYAVFAVSLLWTGSMLISLIRQLADYYQIAVFTIKPKVQ